VEQGQSQRRNTSTPIIALYLTNKNKSQKKIMAKLNKHNSVKQAVKETPFGKVKMKDMMSALKAAKHHFGFNLSTPNGMVGALRYVNISRVRN